MQDRYQRNTLKQFSKWSFSNQSGSKGYWQRGNVQKNIQEGSLWRQKISQKINNRVNRQERALRIVYKDYVSTFAQLLEKDSSVSIHIRNLQILATEIFKARNNLSPPIVQNIFRTIEPAYSLRRDTIFESHRIQTQRYGIESLTYLGPKIWSQVPSEIKESHSLAVFKNKIKNWRPKLCPCKLCKTYVANLGYLWRLVIN